jgi:hypothetical protein
MGKHSKTSRPRMRSLLAAGMVGIGTLGVVGVAHAEGSDAVEGTPCTDDARACVDLASHQAWLIDDGEIVGGPMTITSGAPGKETPKGDFHVQWKDANHRSAEFDNAPMPNSVFFADGGIAFHEGSLKSPSSGCVHLGPEDSKSVYDFLEVGDPVQVR